MSGPRPQLVAALLALFLLPSAYLAWSARDMPLFGFAHDDGIYYVTAKSLGQGNGYRIETLPGQPWQTKYPPLLPFEHSLVWRVWPRFPENLAGAALVAWIWLPIWLALSYRVLRDLSLGNSAALAVCAAMALNQHAVRFAMLTQPELMFAALWTASALLVSKRPLIAGLLGGAAYLAKTAALPMLIAGPALYAIRRRWFAVGVFIAGMLPVVAAWHLWSAAHSEHSTDWLWMYYTDYLGYHWRTIQGIYPSILLKNLDALLTSLGGLLLGWAADSAIAERVAAVVMLVGTIRHCRRVGLTPYHLFTAGYLALLLAWHYPPDPRFLLPVLPVFLAGLWSELRLFYGLLNRTSGLVFAAAVSLLLMYCSATGWARFSAYVADIRHVRDSCQAPAYAWIEANTPADARFLASEDALLFLHTGRRAMTLIPPTRYFYQDDRESVIRLTLSRPSVAREHGLGYVFDAPRDWRREFLPDSRRMAAESSAQLARSPDLRRVYSANGCAVYQLAP